MKITILAELTCLNKLVNNKVVIVDTTDNTYQTYHQGRYTSPMPETFNPEDYALLVTDRYSIIVDATSKMKEKYIVNRLWKEQCDSNPMLKKQPTRYKQGDKIHLENKEGIYTIFSISENGNTFYLTCGTWQCSDRPIRAYDKALIKCLAGGKHNLNKI
jgi:hypothetical protein